MGLHRARRMAALQFTNASAIVLKFPHLETRAQLQRARPLDKTCMNARNIAHRQ